MSNNDATVLHYRLHSWSAVATPAAAKERALDLPEERLGRVEPAGGGLARPPRFPAPTGAVADQHPVQPHDHRVELERVVQRAALAGTGHHDGQAAALGARMLSAPVGAARLRRRRRAPHSAVRVRARRGPDVVGEHASVPGALVALVVANRRGRVVSSVCKEYDRRSMLARRKMTAAAPWFLRMRALSTRGTGYGDPDLRPNDEKKNHSRYPDKYLRETFFLYLCSI